MEPVGRTHGRSDLDRCGLFWEMSYMNGPYVKPLQIAPIKRSPKPFVLGYPKWKRDLQDCYFDTEPLKRIFEGEAFWDALREYNRERTANTKKNVSGNPFITLFPLKASSTPGDYHGTFETKNYESFSPVKRSEEPKETKRGIYTPFPKKGGYGYVGQTFDNYPEHKADYYNAGPALYSRSLADHKSKCKPATYILSGISEPYFDPNPYKVENKPVPPYRPEKKKKEIKATWIWGGPTKKLTGDKGGCFDKYPTHSADKYLTAIQIDKELDKKFKGKSSYKAETFIVPSESKKWLIKSTADYNIKFKVNAKNWKCARPFVLN